MIRLIAMALGLALLTACSGSEPMVQQTARNAAKSVVTNVIAQRFPGVNAAPFTDCIIDNASDQEILNIATGAITGPDEATVQIILKIASRPATVQCIGPAAIGNVLG